MARIEDIYPGWRDRDTAISDDAMLIEAQLGIKKRMKFDASAITPRTTRVLKMPDADVDLAAMLQDILDLQTSPPGGSFAVHERRRDGVVASGYIVFGESVQVGSADIVYAGDTFTIVNTGTYLFWFFAQVFCSNVDEGAFKATFHLNQSGAAFDTTEFAINNIGATFSGDHSAMMMYERTLTAGDEIQVDVVAPASQPRFDDMRIFIKRLS